MLEQIRLQNSKSIYTPLTTHFNLCVALSLEFGEGGGVAQMSHVRYVIYPMICENVVNRYMGDPNKSILEQRNASFLIIERYY